MQLHKILKVLAASKDDQEFGDLKDHARRHSVDGDAVKYYNRAVEHTQKCKMEV